MAGSRQWVTLTTPRGDLWSGMELCTAIMLCLCACLADAPAHAAEQPNILFIFADDWGWGDLSCHGHPYVKTPNIDRLAREGTDFHRFSVADRKSVV